MKAEKKVTLGGNFAKVNKDIMDGDRIKVLDSGQMVQGQYGPKKVFKILTMRKEEFNMTFNQTSVNNLIDEWGPDTESWVNKIAKVFVVRQMIDGSLRNVAYLAPEAWTMDQEGKFNNPNATVQTKPKDIDPDSIPF